MRVGECAFVRGAERVTVFVFCTCSMRAVLSDYVFPQMRISAIDYECLCWMHRDDFWTCVYKYSDISSEVILYNHNQYRSKTLMMLKEVLQSSLVFFLLSQVKMQKRKCSAGQEIEAHPCSSKYNSSLFTLVHADMQTFSFFLLEVLLFASFCWNTYYILSLMTEIH